MNSSLSSQNANSSKMVAFYDLPHAPHRVALLFASLLSSGSPQGSANQAVPVLSAWPRGPKAKTAKVSIIILAAFQHVAALKVLSESSALEWSGQWCSARAKSCEGPSITFTGRSDSQISTFSISQAISHIASKSKELQQD